MNTATHTPTPWTTDAGLIEKGKTIIADCGCDHRRQLEDAAFIVRACNAHDDLVAALRQCVTELAAYDDFDDELHPHNVALKEGRAALAKAGAA